MFDPTGTKISVNLYKSTNVKMTPAEFASTLRGIADEIESLDPTDYQSGLHSDLGGWSYSPPLSEEEMTQLAASDGS